MAYCLRDTYGYIINPKITYWLMKDHQTLNKSLTRNRSGKTWVKGLKPSATSASSCWEFDIKYMLVASKKKNALMLTTIDLTTRYTMGQHIAWSIKKGDVVELFQTLLKTYKLPKVATVRNDNGSQFEAGLVRDNLKQMNIAEDICQPATPQ